MRHRKALMLALWHVFAISVLASASVFVALVAYWTLWPMKPILEIPDNYLYVKNKEVKAGENLILTYYSCKNRNISGTVTRYLEDNQIIYLPSMESNYPKGCRWFEVPVMIPTNTPTDDYTFHTTISYKVNPMKIAEYKFTSEKFKVIGKLL